MCDHKKIAVMPTLENSWGIADTYRIKCLYCGSLLYEDLPYDKVKEFVKMIRPLNTNDLSEFL